MEFLKGMKGVIASVNSPLALAALALLVTGSILYVGAQRGPERPLLIKFGFGLAALFGVLAISGFLMQQFMQSTVVIDGYVREGGRPVSNAIMDLGVARGVSLEDGRVRIAIDRKDLRDQYDVKVLRPGYAVWRETKVGPVPDPIFAEISPERFTADNISFELDPVVSSFVGAPEFMMGMKFINQTYTAVDVQYMKISLRSPSGEIYNFSPFAFIDPFVGNKMPSPFIVRPSAEEELKVVFSDNALTNNVMKLIAESKILISAVCMTPSYFQQADAYQPLEEFFDENFIWIAGSWDVEISISTNIGQIKKRFNFDLSESDQNAIKSTKDAYRKCAGLIYTQRLISSKKMKSQISVKINQ